ncbi:Cytochrome oxidase assembly protein ShyY1 [Solimonas aquatica]|uniref:SURF1-like protein n=1 Tax=Solimonas aquatica TaxID=489703 RepID=A0A1H9BR14_9GAMM|nr:SURF1 family protein [Solimonas aquatica]SEP91396.1 Cytochrome oxidase assembly protein ShyY1 [Solimonas aquatica]
MISARFRPPWWATLLVLLLSALMIRLGVWQLQRGQAKQALRATYAQALAAAPQSLPPNAQASRQRIERVRVRGRFDAGAQLLLDNQGHEGRPGYHVWTPLHRAQDIVMVDRGWIAREQRDAALAAAVPEGELELSAYWRSLPVPGMRLATDNCAQSKAASRLVQYPTITDLRCLYGPTLADGLLLMDAAAPAGFVRDWQTTPELDPAKHWGYAFQWFAFTLTLWFLYLRLNWRRADSHSS